MNGIWHKVGLHNYNFSTASIGSWRYHFGSIWNLVLWKATLHDSLHSVHSKSKLHVLRAARGKRLKLIVYTKYSYFVMPWQSWWQLKRYNGKDNMAKTTQRKLKKRQYDRWDTDHSSARNDGMFVQATSSSESSGQPEENDIWWGRLQWLWWRLNDWPCGEGASVRELIIYNKSRGQEV